MGCGQYSLTDLTMQQLTFSRCKDYYLGEPACETVTFTVADGDSAAAMLLQGESDLDLTAGAPKSTPTTMTISSGAPLRQTAWACWAFPL